MDVVFIEQNDPSFRSDPILQRIRYFRFGAGIILRTKVEDRIHQQGELYWTERNIAVCAPVPPNLVS